jgi:hypothetical protein
MPTWHSLAFYHVPANAAIRNVQQKPHIGSGGVGNCSVISAKAKLVFAGTLFITIAIDNHESFQIENN